MIHINHIICVIFQNYIENIYCMSCKSYIIFVFFVNCINFKTFTFIKESKKYKIVTFYINYNDCITFKAFIYCTYFKNRTENKICIFCIDNTKFILYNNCILRRVSYENFSSGEPKGWRWKNDNNN